MILSSDKNLIVSTLGWTDGGSLWLLDTRRDSVSTQNISDAKYLSLHAGQNGYFAVIHHYDSDRLCISAHTFADPAKALSQILVSPLGNTFEGDHAVWQQLPRAYVAYLKRTALADFHLFLIEPARSSVEIITLDWYDDSYDKGYQGVIGVVEVPGQNQLIISVQRNSHPVLYDLDGRKVVSKLSLAGRGGNPTIRFRQQAAELWADDYDTILRLGTNDWRVMDCMLLQDAEKGTQQFIGAYCFNREETLCAIARPFSGDVVALDTKKFKVTHSCALGDQPLLVSLLSDGTVYSRDWKTGKLLKGKLKKKWLT